MKSVGILLVALLSTPSFGSEIGSETKEIFEKSQQEMVEKAQSKLERMINDAFESRMNHRLKLMSHSNIFKAPSPK